MKAFVPYQEAIANFLAEKNQHKEPRNLYEPIEYILGLGGKRLRPALVIAAANSYGATIEEADREQHRQ